MRGFHFSPFPSPLATATTHHRHPPLPAEESSCCRRSGILPLPLCQLPTSLDARYSGTLPDTGVAVFKLPKSRRPSSLSPFCYPAGRRRKKGTGGRRRRKRKRKRKADRVYFILDGNLWYFEDRIIRLSILDLFALEQESIWIEFLSKPGVQSHKLVPFKPSLEI
uniref:Expressed protein n=1 Tax=Oryza sativa subsp. japonica TaxID=39947 RepID=H2KX06_ORYSJ|nr:expressed protein [Oryza sativa Japonica Group]